VFRIIHLDKHTKLPGMTTGKMRTVDLQICWSNYGLKCRYLCGQNPNHASNESRIVVCTLFVFHRITLLLGLLLALLDNSLTNQLAVSQIVDRSTHGLVHSPTAIFKTQNCYSIYVCYT